MAVMELVPIVDNLAYQDKVDLLSRLIHDIGLDKSLRAMRSYVMNSSESHTIIEEQFLEFVYWLDSDSDESGASQEEEEDRIMAQEIKAYQQMHPNLRDQYLGQYVLNQLDVTLNGFAEITEIRA